MTDDNTGLRYQALLQEQAAERRRVLSLPAPPTDATSAELAGYQGQLFESFRAMGLAEHEARAAAQDTTVTTVALDTQLGVTFGRLSAADAERQLQEAAREVATRTPAPTTTRAAPPDSDGIDVDRIVAEAFKRQAADNAPPQHPAAPRRPTTLTEAEVDRIVAGAFGRQGTGSEGAQ